MPKAIGIERDDGTIEAIYIHNDGLTDGVIEVASRYYRTAKDVSDLIALGDLSRIGRSIGEQHDFDADYPYTTPDRCTAYYRDRDEPWDSVKPKVFKSRKSYLRDFGWPDVDRYFLFDTKLGEWLWVYRRKWTPVGPFLVPVPRCSRSARRR